MAAVEVTISGVLYDKLNRTMQQVVLIGEASLTGLGVGGGPMPPGQGGGGSPPGIWGPTDPRPNPPIAFPPGWVGGVPPGGGGSPGDPPGIWGPTDPRPNPPIAFPPGWVGGVPPGGGVTPPATPQPGDPTTPLPPPEGSGGWPVQPITPPPFVVINYPGIGPVVVAPPAQDGTSGTPPAA